MHTTDLLAHNSHTQHGIFFIRVCVKWFCFSSLAIQASIGSLKPHSHPAMMTFAYAMFRHRPPPAGITCCGRLPLCTLCCRCWFGCLCLACLWSRAAAVSVGLLTHRIFITFIIFIFIFLFYALAHAFIYTRHTCVLSLNALAHFHSRTQPTIFHVGGEKNPPHFLFHTNLCVYYTLAHSLSDKKHPYFLFRINLYVIYIEGSPVSIVKACTWQYWVIFAGVGPVLYLFTVAVGFFFRGRNEQAEGK